MCSSFDLSLCRNQKFKPSNFSHSVSSFKSLRSLANFLSLLHQSWGTSGSRVRETQHHSAVLWKGLLFCSSPLTSPLSCVSVGHRPPSVSAPLLNLSYATLGPTVFFALCSREKRRRRAVNLKVRGVLITLLLHLTPPRSPSQTARRGLFPWQRQN